MDEAKTEGKPDRVLQMARKELMDMFEPSTPSTRLAFKNKFQNSKLTSLDVDPDMWMTELELLREHSKTLKVNIEDKDFVMQLINNFLMEYNSLVKAIKKTETKNSKNKLQ